MGDPVRPQRGGQPSAEGGPTVRRGGANRPHGGANRPQNIELDQCLSGCDFLSTPTSTEERGRETERPSAGGSRPSVSPGNLSRR